MCLDAGAAENVSFSIVFLSSSLPTLSCDARHTRIGCSSCSNDVEMPGCQPLSGGWAPAWARHEAIAGCRPCLSRKEAGLKEDPFPLLPSTYSVHYKSTRPSTTTNSAAVIWGLFPYNTYLVYRELSKCPIAITCQGRSWLLSAVRLRSSKLEACISPLPKTHTHHPPHPLRNPGKLSLRTTSPAAS